MAAYETIMTLLPKLTEDELNDLRKAISSSKSVGFTKKDVDRASLDELKRFFNATYLHKGRETWEFERDNNLRDYSVGAWYSGSKSTESGNVENVIKNYLKSIAD